MKYEKLLLQTYERGKENPEIAVKVLWKGMWWYFFFVRLKGQCHIQFGNMPFLIVGDAISHTVTPFQQHLRQSTAVSMLVITAERAL
jgi:hypothetical protein